MKKFITFLFSIILVLCCSYILTQREVLSIYIDKVRGVDAEQTFSGSKTEANNEENHWFFNDLESRADLFCGQHGGCLFTKQNTIINVNVSLAGKVVEVNEGKAVYDGPPLESNFTYKEVLTSEKPVNNSLLLQMSASQYAGKNFKERLGIEDADTETSDYNTDIALETTGITHYRKEYDIEQENTALAYILSESNYNDTYPRNSYVNMAFWQWQEDGNQASSSGIEIDKLFDGYMESGDIDDTLNKLREEQEKLESKIIADNKEINKIRKQINDAKQRLKKNPNNESIQKEIDKYNYEIEKIKERKAEEREEIAEIKKKITARILELLGVKDNNIEGSTLLKKAQSLWNEAKDFQAMWNEIKNTYSNDYKQSIEVSNNNDNISVQFDEGSNSYIIGPFSISYLERYTGEKRDQETGVVTDALQLCGITGTPMLRVRIDGKESTLRCNEEGSWKFKYKLTDEERKVMWYQKYNLYPHNDEQFYIQLEYQKGLEKIEGLDLDFRWLKAKGRCVKFEGDISVIKWTAKVEEKDCPGGTLCTPPSGCSDPKKHDTAQPHKHADSTTDCGNSDTKYICGGHDCGGAGLSTKCPIHEKVHPSSGTGLKYYHTASGKSASSGGYFSGTDCNNKTAWYICKGHDCTPGKKCEHDEWDAHYVGVELTVKGIVEEEEADIQDIACVPYSYRTYDSLKIGEKHDKDFTFSWDWNIDLTTELAGMVWLDDENQKGDAGSKIDGVKDDGEKGVANVGITVAVYENGERQGDAIAHEKDGKRIEWPIYTDSSGKYQVARLEAPGGGTPKENGKYNMRYYAVEFKYDGQTYKNTVYMTTNGTEGTASKYKENPDAYAKSSMAVETVNSRYKMNTKFGEIIGKEQLANDLTTTGQAVPTDIDGKNPKYDKANDITYTGTENTSPSSITSILNAPGNVSDPSQSSKAKGIYAIKASTYYDDSDTGDISVNRDDYRCLYPMEGTVYTMNKKNQRYIAKYMEHINLGLKKRNEVDISLQKDLYKVTLVVNGQKVVKKYDRYAGQSDSDFRINVEKDSVNNKYKLGLYEKDVSYQSDNYYGNAIQQVQDIKDGTELRVFVTYSVRVYNNSLSNNVEINGINDYYDSTYTLVKTDEEAEIINEDLKYKKDIISEAPYYRIVDTNDTPITEWKSARAEILEGYDNSGDLTWTDGGNVGDMQYSYTDSLSEIKLKVNQYAEIFTTYEVDREGYENMQNNPNANLETRNALFNEKNNIAEVTSYSTYYSDKDLSLAGISYYPYQKDWISGKVDKDSAPNNIKANDLKNRKYHEDDTFNAQGLEINIKEYERSMSGYVWEDSKTEEADKYSISVGDGYYADNEKLIPGVSVCLYEVINLGKYNADGSYDASYDGMDYYYKVPEGWYSGSTTTSANSQTDGLEGNYAFSGFMAGDYVVRFDYGVTQNDGDDAEVYTYNGQDFENTRFMAELSDEQLNNKFLDITGETKINETSTNELKISKARDNESRRMLVDEYSRNIENSRAEILRDRNSEEFRDNTSMYAETPIIQVEVEDPTKLNQTESPLKENLLEKIEDTEEKSHIEEAGYTIKNINFGLEERAKTDLELTQYIEEIRLLKQDDPNNPILRVYLDEDGSIKTDNKDSISIGKITYMPHAESALTGQGFYAIAIEDEYMDDLSLLIKYKIKVTNKSDVDFTGRLASMYLVDDINKQANGKPTNDLYKQNGGFMTQITFDEYLNSINGISSDSTLAKVIELYGNENNRELSNLLSGSNQTEVDYVRPEIVLYGGYVGRYYYENNLCEEEKTYTITNYSYDTSLADVELNYSSDQIVKTTVDKVIDYIDVNTSSFEDANHNSYINQTWEKAGINVTQDGKINKDFSLMDGLLSDESYVDTNKEQIVDEKGRDLVTDKNSNIIVSTNKNIEYDNTTGRVKYKAEEENVKNINPDKYNEDLTTELAPENYTVENTKNNSIIYAWTRKNASSEAEANEMKMDNLAEVLIYSNPTGRRDTDSVPGNAMRVAKKEGFWKAGYNIYKDGEVMDGVNFDDENLIGLVEDDAYAPEYVTIIAPTGIALRTFIRNNIFSIIGLIAVVIALCTMFGIKQVKISKKYRKK